MWDVSILCLSSIDIRERSTGCNSTAHCAGNCTVQNTNFCLPCNLGVNVHYTVHCENTQDTALVHQNTSAMSRHWSASKLHCVTMTMAITLHLLLLAWLPGELHAYLVPITPNMIRWRIKPILALIPCSEHAGYFKHSLLRFLAETPLFGSCGRCQQGQLLK